MVKSCRICDALVYLHRSFVTTVRLRVHHI